MKLKRIIIAAVCILAIQSQACAYFLIPVPVFDPKRYYENIEKFITQTVMTALEYVDTVKNLEKLASLVQIGEQARGIYESYGNATKHVYGLMEHFNPNNEAAFIHTWTDESQWNLWEMGDHLSRWGVEPASYGLLAEIDSMLFGPDPETGLTLTYKTAFDEWTSTITNPAYNRDNVLRRVFTGAQRFDDAGGNLQTEGDQVANIGDQTWKYEADSADWSIVDDTDLDGKKDETRHATDEEYMKLNQKIVDTEMLNFSIKSKMLREDLTFEENNTEKYLREYSGPKNSYTITETEADKIALLVQRNRTLNNWIESEAIIADSKLRVRQASLDNKLRAQKMERISAEVSTALEGL